MARLLVVDDEQSMRVMLEARLAKAGHAVEVAPDFPGVERALADFEFDVVITDLRMRTGQDGLKVLRKVKDAQGEAEVILMTAFGRVEDAVLFLPGRLLVREIGVAVNRIGNGIAAEDALINNVQRRHREARIRHDVLAQPL